jgi:AraC-like DNA-binding protein
VLLTSKGNNDSKAEGLEIGADDYVTKPFNANLLELRVKNLIENRRKLRSSFSKGIYLKPKDIAITASDEIFLQKTIAVVEENIANTNFDVEALEQAMDMSKMQLYRKLKGLTDLAGNEFIRNIRLKRAAQLLEKNDYTVAEVAYQVGFNDPAYFTRMFKKEFGKVPSSRFEVF